MTSRAIVVALVASPLLSAAALADVIHTDVPDVPLNYIQDINLDGAGPEELFVCEELGWLFAAENSPGSAEFASLEPGGEYLRAFEAGELIGPGPGAWGVYGTLLTADCPEPNNCTFTGEWCLPCPARFVGVRVLVGGQTHYGWVRVSITDEPWITMIVHDFAYESRPDVPITAGDTGCAADCDGSGALDIDDFVCFQTLFAIGGEDADCEADGDLDIDDFICFQTAFAIGCP